MDIFQNRWVDRYLLRYGPATILGAGILAYFYSTRRECGITSSLPNDKFFLSSVFVFGGFLFAYVASAPILALHYARILFHASVSPWKRDIPIAVVEISFLVFFYFYFKSDGIEESSAGLLAAAYTMWSAVWVASLITFFKRKTVYDFYKRLCAKRTPENAEIVESYRTLREHGNAFQIMLWEILLALLIFKVLRTGNLPSKESIFQAAMTFLLVWIGPAAIAWSIASRLEADFVNDGTK